MAKAKNKKAMPKERNIIAMAMILRTGGHAGKHTNKSLRGSGKGKGKAARYPKHKGRKDF